MRQRLVIVCACLMVALGCAAGPALAANHDHRAKSTTTSTTTHARGAKSSVSTKAANAVLNDCQSHGQLTHDYPRAVLKKALAIMSAGTQQYSNCPDVIHSQLAHGFKPAKLNGSGGSGSSTTTIVIIVVVVLLLLAAIFGGLAFRRRRGGGGGDGGAPVPSGS